MRNLQRSEIAEVSEHFDPKKQVGSSTMAHKRNPISAENVCGLARIVRAMVTPAFENVPLWHERDLTNSSAERFTLSHSIVLADYILTRTARLFKQLKVDAVRMRENLDRAGPDVMAESVMMVLVAKGVGRQDAHETIRAASMRSAQKGGRSLADELMAEPGVASRITREELDRALDPTAYLGSAERIVELALEEISRH